MPDGKTLATRYVELRGGPPGPLIGDLKRSSTKAGDEAGKTLGTRMHSSFRSHFKPGALFAGLAIGGGVAAFGALTKVFTTGLSEVQDYQAGLAQLQAGLKSTGNVAGITAPQMENLASSIQSYSGQTDDSIVKTESLLLTFTNIKDVAGKNNDIFTQTTKIAADMAARLGGDASGAAIQLGKALNDPVKGITALTRVGVSFSDQQKTQIAALEKSGNVMGAQKIILAELTKEFGGSAKAAGQTLPGQIARLKRSFEDFSQSTLTKLIPVIEKVAHFIQADVVPAVRDGLGASFAYVGKVIANNRPFFTEVGNDLEAIGKFIMRDVVPALREGLLKWWPAVSATIQNTVQVIAHVYNALRDLVLFVSDVFHGKWGKAWNDLKGVVSNSVGAIVTFVEGLPQRILAAIGPIGNLLLSRGKALISGLLNGAAEKALEVYEFIGSLPGKILHGLGDLGKILYDTGRQIIAGLARGIRDAANSILTDTLHFVTGLIPIHKGPIEKDRKLLEPAGKAIIGGLITGMESMTPALRTSLEKTTTGIKDQIATVARARNGLASSITSGLLGGTALSGLTVGGDGTSAPTFGDVRGYLASGLSSLASENAGLKQLIKDGLDKNLTQQLASLAPSQANPLIAAITSAGPAGIKQLNGLERGIGNTATLIGQSVGTQAYGKQQAEMVSSLHRIENLLTNGNAQRDTAPAKYAKATGQALNGVGRSAVQKGSAATKPVKRTGVR